jgi:cysteine synthase A
MGLFDLILPTKLPGQLIQLVGATLATAAWMKESYDNYGRDFVDIPHGKVEKLLENGPSVDDIARDARLSASKAWEAMGRVSQFRKPVKWNTVEQASQKTPSFASIDKIGDTPLVKLEKLTDIIGRDIYVKCEYMNPAGSSKDRVALAIIHDARLHVGTTIYEGTVGSTGISLALVCRQKRLALTIVMPDDQAQEKYDTLLSLGAEIKKVRPCSIVDPNHYVNTASRLATETRGFFCNQFENLSNFRVHFLTTGPEIWRDVLALGVRLDCFVMGAGTGGSLSGIAGFLKQMNPGMVSILADPQGSGLFNKVRHNIMYSPFEQEGTRTRHQVDTIVEGIGSNRLTANMTVGLQQKWVDDAIIVDDRQAVLMSRYIYETEGLYLGSSSSVNLVATVLQALTMDEGSVLVTIACDGGMRHVSKFWDDQVCASFGVAVPKELSLADVLGL